MRSDGTNLYYDFVVVRIFAQIVNILLRPYSVTVLRICAMFRALAVIGRKVCNET